MRLSAVIGVLVGCGVVVAAAAPAATAVAGRPSSQVVPLTAKSSGRTSPIAVSTPSHSSDAYVLADRGTKNTLTTYLARRHHGHWSTLPGMIKVVTKKSKGVDVGVEARGMAALSASSIWLVGSGEHEHAVILHYDGKSFHRAKLPPLSFNQTLLEDISARSKDDVWAVGVTEVPRMHYRGGVLLHYNGHRWSRVTSPRFQNVAFQSVAMSSAHNLWILGENDGNGTTARRYVIIHVNGSHMAFHQLPIAADWSGIAAGSHHRAWVVGNVDTGTEGAPDEHPMSVFWNGGRFRVATPPRPSGHSVALLDVTAISGSKAVAVGSSTRCGTPCTQQTFMETPIAYRWNGSWARASTPHRGRYAKYASFTAIAPLPGGQAIAVGNNDDDGLAGLFNGHSFTKAAGTVPPLRHD